MLESLTFFVENGFSPDDLICLVKNILLSLDKELLLVRDYNVNPDDVVVDVCSDDNYMEKLLERERLIERAYEIEERLALPEEERSLLEAEDERKIKQKMKLWTAILSSLEKKGAKEE